jgi:hypothetical protein
MIRVADWESKLDGLLSERKGSNFTWGQHDCCLFVGDAVLAMSGVDIAEWFRGKYSDSNKAYSLLKDYSGSSSGGIGSVMNQLSLLYNMAEIPRMTACHGDIALCEVVTHLNDGTLTMGVINQDDKILIAGRGKLHAFDKSVGVRFWKTG